MAPIPPLTPAPPDPSGARVTARTRAEVSDETIRQSDAALIYVKLRKMIASDSQPTDTILGTIAVAAQSLTNATGAAIAMPHDGAVVCVGRSGETAPELGDRLDVDSGISGECMRTGVIMRCDDATRDYHVDAEVCRQLGLKSIAVVPLRGQQGRVGVLEAFSTRSYAFSEDKMEILGRLAGLAEAAWARGMATEVAPVEPDVGSASESASQSTSETTSELTPVPATAPNIELNAEPTVALTVALTVVRNQATVETAAIPVTEAPQEPAPLAVSPVPPAEVRDVFAGAQQKGAHTRKKRTLAIIAGAVLGLALLSIYGWKAWYRASIGSGTKTPSAGTQTASTDSQGSAVGAGLAWKPDVVRPTARTTSASKAARTGAAIQIPDAVVRRRPRSTQPADGTNTGTPPNSASDVEGLPQLAAADSSPTALGNALAASPALPKLRAPVSQGTAGGVLLRKVQPVYPLEARRMRIEGSVVLDATVTAQGQVDDLKLVSGHPLLAPAAMDAVRKWRYTPFSLNGKPIPKETRITITFLAPQ